MMAWRLWYSDGSAVGSESRAPEEVPGFGLIAIAQPDRTPGTGNVGYLVVAGYDWYAWHTGDLEWFGVAGDTSIWDHILHREPIVGICQGRRVSRARYEALLAEARIWAEAQRLPVKSGRRPGEISR